MRVSELTLPYSQDLPTRSAKAGSVAPVALDVAIELAAPEGSVGGGRGCEATAGVPVPEAAMHENHRVPSRKDEVGAAGEIRAMKAESEAGVM